MPRLSKTISFLFLFIVTPCFANTYVGEGLAESEKAALNDAYFDLKNLLSDAANPMIDSDMTASIYRKTLTLPIIGEIIKTSTINSLFHTTVEIDRSSLSLYQERIKKTRKEIELLTQNSTPANLLNLLVKINELDGLSIAASLLGNTSISTSSDAEDVVKKTLLNKLKIHGSLDEAITKALQQLNINYGQPILTYPPFTDGSAEITPFSKSVQTLVEKYTGRPTGISENGHSIMGEYEVHDNTILLSLFRFDYKNTPLKSALVILDKKQFSTSNFIPAYGKFTRKLTRGLVLISSKPTPKVPSASHSKEGKKTNQRPLRVSIKTDKGVNGISYFIGESGNLYFKLSEPGHIYIIGHILKKGKTLSYILPLNNDSGTNRFIMKIKQSDAKTWQLLGEFSIDAPLGLEALQIFGSSKHPGNNIPAANYDDMSGLYIIGLNPENTVIALRGLVKLSDSGSKNVVGDEINANRYAEDTMQFTTLSKN